MYVIQLATNNQKPALRTTVCCETHSFRNSTEEGWEQGVCWFIFFTFFFFLLSLLLRLTRRAPNVASPTNSFGVQRRDKIPKNLDYGSTKALVAQYRSNLLLGRAGHGVY